MAGLLFVRRILILLIGKKILFSVFLNIFAQVNLFELLYMVKFGLFDDFVELLGSKLVGLELLKEIRIDPEVFRTGVKVGGD